MGQSCLVRGEGVTVVSNPIKKMLYPVLKRATTFPLGSHSEGLDLLQREVSSRHLRSRSEDPFVPNNEEIGRMRREFFTPEPHFSRPTFYYPRPDPDIQFQSLATRRGITPQLHRSGCSSSYADRSKYLPSTPKVHTQFPRFHTGFQY